MKAFPCTSCGECCRNISHIPDLKDFDNGNGVCKFLSKDNRCIVYSNRPEVCQIDLMYKKHYLNKFSEIDYIQLNVEACNSLQEEAGLSTDFRVKFEVLDLVGTNTSELI